MKSGLIEKSLVIKKETIYDKIRRNLLMLIYQKDYQAMQRLDELIQSKRRAKMKKIVIPKEIGKDIKKY